MHCSKFFVFHPYERQMTSPVRMPWTRRDAIRRQQWPQTYNSLANLDDDVDMQDADAAAAKAATKADTAKRREELRHMLTVAFARIPPQPLDRMPTLCVQALCRTLEVHRREFGRTLLAKLVPQLVCEAYCRGQQMDGLLERVCPYLVPFEAMGTLLKIVARAEHPMPLHALRMIDALMVHHYVERAKAEAEMPPPQNGDENLEELEENEEDEDGFYDGCWNVDLLECDYSVLDDCVVMLANLHAVVQQRIKDDSDQLWRIQSAACIRAGHLPYTSHSVARRMLGPDNPLIRHEVSPINNVRQGVSYLPWANAPEASVLQSELYSRFVMWPMCAACRMDADERAQLNTLNMFMWREEQQRRHAERLTKQLQRAAQRQAPYIGGMPEQSPEALRVLLDGQMQWSVALAMATVPFTQSWLGRGGSSLAAQELHGLQCEKREQLLRYAADGDGGDQPEGMVNGMGEEGGVFVVDGGDEPRKVIRQAIY